MARKTTMRERITPLTVQSAIEDEEVYVSIPVPDCRKRDSIMSVG